VIFHVTESALLFLIVALTGYMIGHHRGVDAERLRVSWLFDCAQVVVRSGALYKVQRAVNHEVTRERMQAELLREAEHRAREKTGT
jgi:hypothetical protein